MYFDSHAHFDDERFDEDRESLLMSLQKEKNVDFILNPGVDLERSKKAVALAEQYDFIYAGVGFHPHDVEGMTEQDIKELEELAQYKKVVAIGEIGLDYYYDHSPRELQKHWFIKQIELAKRIKKPIIVHDRDAHGDTLRILKETYAEEVGGVLHCFAGSVEMAEECNKMGFYIGVGGVVTFKNARKLIEVVEKTPIEWLLIETDAPYLTPEPHRGKRNDSSYLAYVVEKIAQVKGCSIEDVSRITKENVKRLFGI